MRRLVLVLGLVALTTGCTMGPDPQRPVTVADDADAFVHTPDATPPTSAESAAEIGAWWRTFGDPATAELVEAALIANTDLRAAAARVLEAQAQLRVAKSTRLPQVTAGAGANRNKNSFTLPEIGRVSVYSTTYSASVDVSYQVDLFGRLKRTREAAWADLLAEEAARQTIVHSVIAEVVRARTQLSTFGRAVEVAQEVRDSWNSTLETTERRYRAGLATALDLRLARENLASAEASLVLSEQRLDQTRLGLDVLLGRRPGTGEVPSALLDPLPSLDPVPLGLPADLLDRRPDLRQSELRLMASTARIGVAMANLFPSLTLTGSTGSNSDTLGDLLSSETLIYNAVANLVAPIFTAGQRRADVRAAEARAEQAAAAYAGAVLGALREVEDALVRDAASRERLEHLDTRLGEARAAHEIAQERYRRGVLPLLQVLETERRLRLAEEALITAQGDSWDTRVDLFLALGGDWTPDAGDSEPRASDAEPSELDASDTDDPTSSREDA